jgi:hypothetical protein
MAEPTPLDIENAQTRAEIAAKFKADYDEALVLAEQVFGPGWEPRGRHMLVDKDEEDRRRKEGGQTHYAAIVYSASKDGEMRHFAVADGTAVECPSVEAGFGAMYQEKHPTKGFEHRGQWIPFQRYSLYWAGYEPDYHPKSAEQLAAARLRREEKAVEREAQAAPLFADLIREEGYVPKRRAR